MRVGDRMMRSSSSIKMGMNRSAIDLFDIVVAYPVEYASWVEKQRSTTGILQTYAYAERVGTTFLGLPRAA